MDTINKIIKTAAIVAVLMVTGVSASYLYGYEKGNFNGYENGYYTAIEKAAEMQEEAQKQAAIEAAREVNPFEDSANLFEKSPINPFDDIETNPYK